MSADPAVRPAYAAVTAAYKLPKGTPEEKASRREAIQVALADAMDVPLRTCRAALAGLEQVATLEGHCNPNLASDVSVAATALGAGIRSAWCNVLVNLRGLSDPERAARVEAEGAALRARARELEDAVVTAVDARLST